MKSLLFVTVIIVMSLFSCAPKENRHPEHDAILKPINALFDGMRASDSTLVASAFLDRTPGFSTIVRAVTGETRVQNSSLPDILVRISTPREEILDEQIYDIKLLSDGTMAMAWTPYKFYIGTTFSHCGVNQFTLAKTEEGWKITSVTDTRRKEPCE